MRPSPTQKCSKLSGCKSATTDLSISRGVVERPDHYCGDDLVGISPCAGLEGLVRLGRPGTDADSRWLQLITEYLPSSAVDQELVSRQNNTNGQDLRCRGYGKQGPRDVNVLYRLYSKEIKFSLCFWNDFPPLRLNWGRRVRRLDLRVGLCI